MNIIQIYAPTADESVNEIEEIYNHTNKQDVNLIMSDFNAKIGSVITPEIIGKHGIGERNEREE